jgi:hypothetical protein
MKTITVLVPLNFDVENGNLEEVQSVIDSINGLLSRNTYDCNDAQILISGISESDITLNDYSEED